MMKITKRKFRSLFLGKKQRHSLVRLRRCFAVVALTCLAISNTVLAQTGNIADPEALASLDLIKEFEALGRPDSWTSSNIPFNGHLLTGIEEASGALKLQRIRARSWAQQLFANGQRSSQSGSYSVTTMLLKAPAGSEKDLQAVLWQVFGDGPTSFPMKLEEKLEAINARHKAALPETTTDYNISGGEIGQETSSLSLAGGQYEYVEFAHAGQAMSVTTYLPVTRISSRVEYADGRGKYVIQHQSPTGGRVESLHYKTMAVAHGPYILIAEVLVANQTESAARVTRDEKYQHIQAYGPPIHPFPDDLWSIVVDGLSPYLPSNANSTHSGVTNISAPGVGSSTSTDASCDKSNIEVLKKKLIQSGPGFYVLCARGGGKVEDLDVEIDATGQGNYQEYLGRPIPLAWDSTIITGPDSEALIVSKNNYGEITLQLRVSEQTHFKLARFMASEEGITADTNMKIGEVDVKVDRRYEAMDFSVSIPTCIAGVRGTDFTVSHSEQPFESHITVRSGKVLVTPKICPVEPLLLKAGETVMIDRNCADGHLQIQSTQGAVSNSVGIQTNGHVAPATTIPVAGSGEAELNIDRPGSAYTKILKSFTIPPRSGSYAWEETNQLTIPGSGAVVFEAKARNDIHVSFAQTASDQSPLYEVVIGGWNNTQTVIRKGRQTPQQGHTRVNVKQNPQAVVSANQWATYWVSVDRGVVMVGRGEIPGQNVTLTWQDPLPLQNLRVLGFSTWNTPVDYRNIRLLPAAGT